MRYDLWAFRVGLSLLGATYVLDLLGFLVSRRNVLPLELHGDLLHGALALIAVGAAFKLKAISITPIREAFMHGYQKCKEDIAAQQAESSNEGGAQVLRLPIAAYSSDIRYASGSDIGEDSGRIPRPRPYGRHAVPTSPKPSRPGGPTTGGHPTGGFRI